MKPESVPNILSAAICVHLRLIKQVFSYSPVDHFPTPEYIRYPLIALMALEIGPGDEVITLPYTWISTAGPAL